MRGSVIRRCWTCKKNTGKQNTKKGASCDHPNARYSIAYWLGGKQKWEGSWRCKKDAQRRLTEVLAGLQQGTFSLPKPILFHDFSAQWLRDYAEVSVKPLTLRGYRYSITRHLIPEFGNLRLNQISVQNVQSFVSNCVRRHPKPLKPKSTNIILALLKMMLKHAKEWGYLRDNPAERVKPLKVPYQEMDCLRPDEIQLFLKYADEPSRTLFLTAILTGMRRGEVLGLQWGDIDWQNCVIHVKRSLYFAHKSELGPGDEAKSKWRFSTPKSEKSIRKIAVSPTLKEALELHRLVCPVSPDDLVFCTKEGKPLHAENMVKRQFLPALSRAGLRRIRFHDLRHTYTSLLIASGVNPKVIQSQLGHASIETTFDRYGHLLHDIQRQVGEHLDAIVFDSPQHAQLKAQLKTTAQASVINAS